MPTCYRHPDRETGVSCSNCARPICPDCMTPTSVGMRCPECSRDRTPVKTLRNIGTDPVATYTLIAVSVIAFIATLGGGGGVAERGGGSIIDKGALCGNGVGDGGFCGGYLSGGHEPWRLLTSGFLHGGLLHVGFNMYLLYILGQMLEPALGRVRFLAVYFTSLLAGSLGALLLSSPAVNTVGASGAVFGLMGAAVVSMRARGFDPGGSGIPGLIGLNLLLTFLLPGISIGGHVGGLIGGALSAYLLVDLGERRGARTLPLVGVLVIAAVVVAGSLAFAGSAPVADLKP